MLTGGQQFLRTFDAPASSVHDLLCTAHLSVAFEEWGSDEPAAGEEERPDGRQR